MKIGKPSNQVETEFNTLAEYNGRRFCKVFYSDIEKGIILEEQLKPGITLWEGTTLDQRIDTFCSLYNGLHLAPVNPKKYPSYIDWLTNVTEYMSNRHDCEQMYLHMRNAYEMCLSLTTTYTKQMLLHGDIHPDNILLCGHGEYKLIDPKGVIGDPIFDIAHYILNEFNENFSEELYKKIEYIIRQIESKLNIPNTILKKCLYIQTALTECWDVEDGSDPSIDKILFVENMLKK